MQKRRFSLVELLVVMTILIILMGIFLPGIPTEPIHIAETRGDIANIELALNAYRSNHGTYPFEDRTQAVNLSDASDSEVKKVIVELLKLHTFSINEQGVPMDAWENPIYFIHHKNYRDSPLTGSFPNLSERVYYNPRSFQLVSGGPDGTETSLGSVEDNVANYPKR